MIDAHCPLGLPSVPTNADSSAPIAYRCGAEKNSAVTSDRTRVRSPASARVMTGRDSRDEPKGRSNRGWYTSGSTNTRPSGCGRTCACHVPSLRLDSTAVRPDQYDTISVAGPDSSASERDADVLAGPR